MRRVLKALLLENIHPSAVARLKSRGVEVETSPGALDEDELIARLPGVQLLGIRSKTRITERVLSNAPDLLAIGAFCIGTNQIDLRGAARHGVAVFNAPYSNTRSVVELVVGELIMLMRHVPEHDRSLHEGIWDKTANDSHEVRGHTLGIVGYGNIGAQLSVLAEALGMRVVFHDIQEKLALGNAERKHTLPEVLAEADVVTLHVDGRPENRGFFGAEQFAQMKEGAKFLNISRGFVVDLAALHDSLASGHLGGAAIDVYPAEPKKRGDAFASDLTGFPNVILTPHIGGSTLEAQHGIGEFVSAKLIDYVLEGQTDLSVNLPGVTLQPWHDGLHRIAFLHRNVPGVLAKVNRLFGDLDVNIDSQVLGTWGEIGYAVSDVSSWVQEEVLDALRAMPESIDVRVMG